MNLRNALALLIGLFMLAGCSSTQLSDQLGRVKSGMTKQEVLGIAGNPSRSGRSQGADKWSYDIFDSSKRRIDVVEVYFKEGAVNYVGSENDIAKMLKKPHHTNDDDSGFREL